MLTWFRNLRRGWPNLKLVENGKTLKVHRRKPRLMLIRLFRSVWKSWRQQQRRRKLRRMFRPYDGDGAA